MVSDQQQEEEEGRRVTNESSGTESTRVQESTCSTFRKFLSNLSPGLNINFQTPRHSSTRDDGKHSIRVQHESCPKPGPGRPGLVPGGAAPRGLQHHRDPPGERQHSR